MKKTFKTLALMLLTVFAVSSCVDVPAPYVLPGSESETDGKSGTTIEPAGDGTSASPYNVAAIVAKIKEMEAGVESTEEYYIKGKVINVKTDEETIKQYGNHTFEMVDEGNNSTVFTAFQVYGPGKKKFTSVSDIKVGDEVVVCGKVVNFRGNTPETVGKGAAYVVSINSSSEGGDEQAKAVTCAEAVELTKALEDGATSSETYSITGYITEVVGAVSRNQQTFWMADTKDGGQVFEAYWANLPEGVTEFKVGMKVKITGQLMKYVKGDAITPEIKNATVVILENGGSEPVVNPEGTPVTCVEAKAVAEALVDNATTETTYSVTGYITDVPFDVSTKTGTPQQTFWMADTKDGGKVFQAYYANVPSTVSEFKVGMKVTATGKIMKFVNANGMTPEIKNADVIILEDGGSVTPPAPGGDVEHITVAEFLQKADANTVYELTGTVKNITNTTYGNFDLVDGDASIYIYGLLNLNGEKQKFAAIGIEEGDIVTLTGKYKLYNNKPEIVDAQLVSFTKGQGGDEPTPSPGGETVSDLVNGDFESWASDSEPTGWKSASTASNATLEKSNEARSGIYACKILAPGTQNKRLATQEMTLEAGSYTFSYYAKSTTSDVCQSRGGYVPVNADGSVGAYQYNKIYTDLNSNNWTLVSYDFELESATTLCLFASNPKENAGKTISQDILIDDATLVKK